MKRFFKGFLVMLLVLAGFGGAGFGLVEYRDNLALKETVRRNTELQERQEKRLGNLEMRVQMLGDFIRKNVLKTFRESGRQGAEERLNDQLKELQEIEQLK